LSLVRNPVVLILINVYKFVHSGLWDTERAEPSEGWVMIGASGAEWKVESLRGEITAIASLACDLNNGKLE